MLEGDYGLGKSLLKSQTVEELQRTNFSRIVCLPCREETIRGCSNGSLLGSDEVSRVPDDVYRAVRPPRPAWRRIRRASGRASRPSPSKTWC